MNEQLLNNNASAGMRQGTGKKNPHAAMKRKRAKKRRLLEGLMLITGGMAIVLCLLLVIFPCFRVRKIKVEGLSYHSEEELLSVIDLSVGDELFAADLDRCIEQILSNCTYVETVNVRISFPSVVRITVTERAAGTVMYTSFNDSWISFDESFRVLEQTYDKSDFAPFLEVELPSIASMSVGGQICFADTESDHSYILDALNLIESANTRATVTALNVRSRHQVSFVMGDSCRVVLGNLGDAEQKLALADRILGERDPALSTPSVVDVSNLAKCVYRVAGEGENI